MSELHNNTLYIAGQGAISSFCAANLCLNQMPVKQLVKDKYAGSQVAVSGLTKPVTLPKAVTLEQIETIDYLLVPLKAYDVEQFIRQVLPKLAKNAHVILSHNGMGTIEPVTALLPKSTSLYFCTTNNGAFKHAAGVQIAGLGQSFWSQLQGPVTGSLTNVDFSILFQQAQRSDDLLSLLWQKLLINSVINPLTAIYRVKNGELAKPQYNKEVRTLVYEFVSVAAAEGMDMQLESAIQKVQLVIKQTAANTSSMLQDVQNGKATEIDFILGYVLDKANEHGIHLPLCQHLHQQLKGI